MFELKPIHKDAIPAALAKAEKYRLLNEPRAAESICRDVIRADADNQDALVLLMLCLSDQFKQGRLLVNVNHAQEVLARITDEYLRTYYAGVICERWAKAQFDEGSVPGYVVFEWLRQAMDWYEKAEPLSPAGNADAVLRWNTCARIIKRHDQIRPEFRDDSIEAGFEDEVPFR